MSDVENFEYDVALSYAGEDREYVELVANILMGKKIDAGGQFKNIGNSDNIGIQSGGSSRAHLWMATGSCTAYRP